MTVLLAPGEDPETIALTREEGKKLYRRRVEPVAENVRLRKVEAQSEEYPKRHPEMVGIKHGKPYALRSTAEPRTSGGRPDVRPGHAPRLRPRPRHVDRKIRLTLDRSPDCGGPRPSEV